MKRDDQYRYTLTMETLTVALAIMVDRNIIAINDLDQVTGDIGAIHELLSNVFLNARVLK